MKTALKISVLGMARVGKTTLIEQTIYGNKERLKATYEPTCDDVYCALIDIDHHSKCNREKVYFYDYEGVTPPLDTELVKLCLSSSDAFVLVYSIDNAQSFDMVRQIKKVIDQFKDKKDPMPVIVLANKMDLYPSSTRVDLKEAQAWAMNEKIRHHEVSGHDRKSIVDALQALVSKLALAPSHKSPFMLMKSGKSGNIPLEL